MKDETLEQQEALCKKYDAGYCSADLDKIAGVADNVVDPTLPVNGLRHPTTDSTTGWYIWAGGEPSSNPKFFKPMHLKHLIKSRPEIIPYLGLPPGWRFLIDPNNSYEDVWRDDTLLIDD